MSDAKSITPLFDSLPSERVYLVYEDKSYPGHSYTGQSQYVTAKSRNDAKTKVDFSFTHVAWKPELKFINGMFIDRWGKEYV